MIPRKESPPAPPAAITVLAVDDNVIVRAGLVALLEASDDITVISEASDGLSALDLARRLNPDVVLLDVRMPILDGISTLDELAGLAAVIMLTHTDTADIINTALEKGAAGYLVHGHFSAEELHRSIRSVADGAGTPLSPVAAKAALEGQRGSSSSLQTRRSEGHRHSLGLTEREEEVLSSVVRGLNNKAVSQELFLTEKTVKNHLNRIFRKLQVTTRAEAIAVWNGDYRA